MIGVIYKFTCKLSGRFYIGQHVCNSVEEFLRCNKSSYWGSGTIWFDLIKNLKRRFPNCWFKLIHREVVCVIRNADPISMNKMEEYFINKLDGDYKRNKGGCNILQGAAYGKDWVNAMKSPEIRKKVSDKNKISMKGVLAGEKHWNYGKHRSDETKRKISIAHIGKKVCDKTYKLLLEYSKKPKSIEHRKKIGDAQRGNKSIHFGVPLSDEHKRKVGNSLKEYYSKHESSNKNTKWITNGHISKKIRIGDELPNGWRYGRVYN